MTTLHLASFGFISHLSSLAHQCTPTSCVCTHHTVGARASLNCGRCCIGRAGNGGSDSARARSQPSRAVIVFTEQNRQLEKNVQVSFSAISHCCLTWSKPHHISSTSLSLGSRIFQHHVQALCQGSGSEAHSHPKSNIRSISLAFLPFYWGRPSPASQKLTRERMVISPMLISHSFPHRCRKIKIRDFSFRITQSATSTTLFCSFSISIRVFCPRSGPPCSPVMVARGVRHTVCDSLLLTVVWSHSSSLI